MQGGGTARQFLYATLPQVMSYSLYRWENNIRTAAVLIAMPLLVALVDGASFASRRWLTR